MRFSLASSISEVPYRHAVKDTKKILQNSAKGKPKKPGPPQSTRFEICRMLQVHPIFKRNARREKTASFRMIAQATG